MITERLTGRRGKEMVKCGLVWYDGGARWLIADALIEKEKEDANDKKRSD